MASPGTAGPPPLSAFGQLPNVAQVNVSPDGSKFAAVVGSDASRQVQLRAIAGNTLITVFNAGDTKIRSVTWAGPNHLLLTASQTGTANGIDGGKREWFQLLDYELRKGKWRKPMDGSGVQLNVVTGAPVPFVKDGAQWIMVEGFSFPATRGVSTLYRLNLDNPFSAASDVGTEDTDDWVVGTDGRAIARADYRRGSGEWTLFLRPPGRSGWTRAKTLATPIDAPDLIGLGSAGSVLVAVREDDVWQTHAVTVADGSWSAPMPEISGNAVIRDPATRAVIGSRGTSLEGIDYKFMSDTDQKLWTGLRKAFPGEMVRFVAWSDDRMTIIVNVDGPINGDSFYLVDRHTRSAKWLVDEYAGVGPEMTAERRTIHYKAADGLDIGAYLTLPRGKPAKALPLIVFPHGGPAARDEPGFDWWAQAMASRGYAVLQPQFRGSAGFGPALLDAGYGEIGRKMQTDLSDGVRQLVKDSVVDATRVCIAGASYGGYAALAGVAIEHGPYRCAVSVAGVGDLRAMLSYDQGLAAGSSRTAGQRYWRRLIGVDSNGDKRIDAWSPLMHATGVKVPVLLVHGKDDTVVEYSQSARMASALQAAGTDVKLVTLAGEDHWLSRSATRIQMLEAVVAFLEKHNPPGAVAQTPAAH